MTHHRAPMFAVFALLAAGPALAHPGLESLIPLTEVYGIAVTPTPPFDVAGIRCAGLFAAQQHWAEAHRNQGMPSAARLRDIELNLDRAQIARTQAGMDLSRAHGSVQDDILSVTALYAARFQSRDQGDGLPWAGDGLITSDTAYCDILNGRH